MVSLVVNDGRVNSMAATVTIIANLPPVANAAPGQNRATGTLVTLDGSGSTDADGDALTYHWSFTAKPADSTATLSSATVVSPTFMADKDGVYVLNLVVYDGHVESAPFTVTIIAFIPGANFTMPDTNLTLDYYSMYGDDSFYTINPPSYTDNLDGTITDNVTTLVWQQQVVTTFVTWADAITYCDNLILGGRADWRLPSRIELVSLIDNSRLNPSINTTYFIAPNLHLWSSTTYYDSPTADGYRAWEIALDYGFLSIYPKAYAVDSALCVRGGH